MAKKYIVIGAGWMGIRAVKTIEAISKDAEVTVLEIGSKDYIDVNLANPRLMVEPEMVEKVYQPLAKAWSRAKLVNVKEIKQVASGKVVYTDKGDEEQTLEADGIVVATGSVQASPLIKDITGKTKEERVAQFTAFKEAVQNSKTGVIVVGGGTTGVEVAGEIAIDFPDAKVTLLNKAELLLRGSSKRASMHKIALKQLQKFGVTVINSDHIEDLSEDYVGEPKKFTTAKGVELEADVVVMCAGGRPNVPFPCEGALDEDTKGLQVNAALLCEKLGEDPTKPVWALGDCTMYGGRGMFGEPQIGALSASIKHFDQTDSTKDGPMKYKHKPSEQFPSLVSVGRKGAAFTEPFPNVKLGKILKVKDLGVAYIYKKDFKVKV